ncbi:putative 5,10-methylenetetrahydromethanopterin reductase domain protein [Mycobacterium ulcerans str. Harvey]|uniref:5,10-methylenetetrahydromethanopterin reductase domain protein n=1 Tax=Mycobacterium ulcerans str. Harvey TaxID=1299332 RepID=A0ABP3A4D4_MYCUL|nr:putative 5,10-methylenetetrahydromethanopterin reductase domain protein [Mycobacterium ulcerans str. Harvey]
MMRTATTVELSGGKDGKDTVDFVVEAEKLGLHTCWVAEAWAAMRHPRWAT